MKPVSAKQISTGIKVLTDNLTAKLTTALLKAARPATKRIAVQLKAGLFEEAKLEVRELEFTEVLEAQHKTIRKYTRSTFLVGAGALDSPAKASVANGASYPFESDVKAVQQLTEIINRILVGTTKRNLIARINRASRHPTPEDVANSVLLKAETIDPKELANKINRVLRGEIRRVVDVSANIIGTRVSAFGMLHEARVRGVSRYRIDAVIDDRTTDICRELNGKVFEVATAYKRTQILLSLEAKDVKAAAPFPELSDIAGKDAEALREQGHDVPPFHFQCRTVLTLIDKKDEEDFKDKEVASTGSGATKAAVTGIASVVGETAFTALSTKLGQEAGILIADRSASLLSVPNLITIRGLPGPLAPALQIAAPKQGDYPIRLSDPPWVVQSALDHEELHYASLDKVYDLSAGAKDMLEDNGGNLGQIIKSPKFMQEAPEVVAVHDYTGNGYRKINSVLRDGDAFEFPYQNTTVGLLDDLTLQSELPEDLILWRGTAWNSGLADRLETGAIFQDDGFVSASTLQDTVLSDFIGGRDDTILFQIFAAKGSSGFYAGTSTAADRPEWEYILPRSSQFRVIGKTKEDDVTRIQLVYMGQGDRLEIEQFGTYLPTAEGVTKTVANEPTNSKFYWGLRSIREAAMKG